MGSTPPGERWGDRGLAPPSATPAGLPARHRQGKEARTLLPIRPRGLLQVPCTPRSSEPGRATETVLGAGEPHAPTAGAHRSWARTRACLRPTGAPESGGGDGGRPDWCGSWQSPNPTPPTRSAEKVARWPRPTCEPGSRVAAPGSAGRAGALRELAAPPPGGQPALHFRVAPPPPPAAAARASGSLARPAPPGHPRPAPSPSALRRGSTRTGGARPSAPAWADPRFPVIGEPENRPSTAPRSRSCAEWGFAHPQVRTLPGGATRTQSARWWGAAYQPPPYRSPLPRPRVGPRPSAAKPWTFLNLRAPSSDSRPKPLPGILRLRPRALQPRSCPAPAPRLPSHPAVTIHQLLGSTSGSLSLAGRGFTNPVPSGTFLGGSLPLC